ncbi:unnamed protein product (macronuclear) [Paramecium tetraurelia]|uniref:CAP-Gly domain-containing protein n=1 Tax=Paramecium tetraurelia TaxID=5888 RepID=A0CPE5_PARTE|nr:uncharacterized protein GSPATT00009053001 [Paramecium tetraurelia]CAK72662.1 unnamed protein product [Paramecium tetraurelia]|eukprot:XP_001440059.1 hypothetical protein (macronuclear) [Paramecium tetraurelia strain d4-2]
MNKRIVYQGEKATVKYEGPLMHENKGDEIWLGVEWDQIDRGKHNGTVQGYTYFKTTDGANSGSLLKKEKVKFGNRLWEALFLKYFKEIPPILLQEMQVQEQVKDEFLQEHQDQGNNKDQKSQMITLINQKQVKIEFDDTAFFETMKMKKKMVEFYGFDEVYKKLNNLETLSELSLESQNVSTIGPFGFVGSIFSNIKILGLEDNLFHSWHQIFVLVAQLPTLRELSISSNKLSKLETFGQQQILNQIFTQTPDYLIYDYEQGKHLEIPVDGCGKHIEILVLIDMQLNWKDISLIIPAFPKVQQLLLCKNTLVDYENLQFRNTDLQDLKILNLEQTGLQDFDYVQKSFGNLPNLERLILNKNNLIDLPLVTEFKALKHLALDHNHFAMPQFLNKIGKLQLNSLSIKHNPLVDKFGKLYLRQRAIAEVTSVQIINGSEITKFERKDSEIFYLKSSFEEYFLLKNVKHYYYDYDDFINYAQINHPKAIELIKKFGNPYEIDPTVKGGYTQTKQQLQQPQYCTIKIIDHVGKLQDKPTSKKLMGGTGLQPVKLMISKLVNIPIKQIALSIQVTDDAEIVNMEGKDMTLNDFGVQDNSLIHVNVLPE